MLNNPLRYTDPTGNRPWDGEPEDDGGGGGGGGDGGDGGEGGGGDTGGGDTGSSLNPDEGSPAFETPPGADLSANIEYAEEHGLESVLSSRPDFYEDPVVNVIASVVDFVNHVREGGEWDYKKDGHSEYEDFGNVNYGATGTAWGFTGEELLRAAGVVQSLTDVAHNIGAVFTNILGQNKTELYQLEPGIPGVSGPYYGDHPNDQAMIRAGFGYAGARR